MKNFGDKIWGEIKNWPWKYIGLVLLTILFFSFTVVITFDGGHYLNYVAIFERELPASTWDVVRGPIFPLIIFASDKLFGKTGTGFLICLYIFYLLFAVLCYVLCKLTTKNLKHEKAFRYGLMAILILNPLIFGYFHVMLTEFVAIFMALLNIYVAYKWLGADLKKRKTRVFYLAFFVISILFCYHLKQPYLSISLAPLMIAALVAIVRDHTLKNVWRRLEAVLVSLVLLAGSIVAWNLIMDRINATSEETRTSGALLGKQIVAAAGISTDLNGNGEEDDVIAVSQGALIVLKHNPLKNLGTYALNYCALTSMCRITTENGVNFTPLTEIQWISLYENLFIGYETYRDEDPISPMPEEMRKRAELYQSNISKSWFVRIMARAELLTNILYKLSLVACLPMLIIVLIRRAKDKTKKLDDWFYAATMLLAGASAHLLIGAGLGLIIDRYSVEAFVPAMLGEIIAIRYLIVMRNERKGSGRGHLAKLGGAGSPARRA